MCVCGSEAFDICTGPVVFGDSADVRGSAPYKLFLTTGKIPMWPIVLSLNAINHDACFD